MRFFFDKNKNNPSIGSSPKNSPLVSVRLGYLSTRFKKKQISDQSGSQENLTTYIQTLSPIGKIDLHTVQNVIFRKKAPHFLFTVSIPTAW
jgi:hypothetical protein